MVGWGWRPPPHRRDLARVHPADYPVSMSTAEVPTAPLVWPDLAARQQPPWPDANELAAAVARLRQLPPLVFAGECDLLIDRLAQACNGQAFVLMGGDCAETFAANTADSIRARLKTLLQMSVVLTYAASMPVVKVGRLAGQYFKPRSKAVEVRDGIELTSYFGDAVNELAFDAVARRPDADRLVQAYHASSAALNLVRAFTQGGYADLRQVHAWNQDFVRDSIAGQRYDQLAQDIDRALAFMHACGADPAEFQRVEFYAAHEALSIDYERALTRIDSRTGLPYDVSGHFLWIGERTRQLDGAHVHFASTIRNPVGVKIGPTADVDDVIALCERLNPQRVPGRLTLITRMGAGQIRQVAVGIGLKCSRHGRDGTTAQPSPRRRAQVLAAPKRAGMHDARFLRREGESTPRNSCRGDEQGAHAWMSMSATRKDSSRLCSRFNRGSQAVS